MGASRIKKEKTERSTLASNAISRCKGLFAAIVFFSFCVNLLTLVLPLYMVQLYDRVLPNRSVDTLLVLTAIVLIALMTSAGLDAVRATLLTRMGAWVEDRLGPFVLSGAIGRARNGDTNSAQGLRDLSQIKRYLSGSGLTPLLDAPWTPIFIFVLYVLHPFIGIITLGGAIILLGLAWLNESLTKKASRDSGDSWEEVMDDANAIVRNSAAVSAMGMRANIIKNWRKDSAASIALQSLVVSRSRIIASSAKFVRFTVQITVMCTAAWLIMNGELTGGALMASLLLMRRAIAPVEQSITSWKSLQSARHSLARVDLYLKNAEKEYPAFQPPHGSLEVSDVRYYHNEAKKPVLRKVSFKVKPGEAVAVVGPTGAGKSTLASLIVGNDQPYRGHIRLDGIEITDWDPEKLGPFLGYLPQEVALFKGTVAENIARMDEISGRDVADDIIAASRMADAHDMLLDLPEGFDTPIGTDGVKLSGGQRQRVGLARAVYRSPRLVVLDEPDAHLDRDGRQALSTAIRHLKAAGSIVILITHQVKVPEHIDRMLLLNNGKVERLSQQQLEKKRESSRKSRTKPESIV